MSAVQQPQPKRRRTHQKSKTGCSECKRRHVRCDERRPFCSNCAAARLSCPFQNEASGLHGSPAAVSNSHPTSTSGPASEGEPDVNMLHIQLYQNFMSETSIAFARTEQLLEVYRRNVMQCALAHPFLMHEVLAVSALQLSLQSPVKAPALRNAATSLQSKALRGLDITLLRVDRENCLPIVLFSHMLGVQSFFETFATRDDGFGTFLGRLIHSINLLRGINAVLEPWHPYLAQEDIGQLITDAHERRNRPQIPGTETKGLYELIHASEISEATRHVYEITIGKLQQSFDEYKYQTVDEPVATASTVFAWLMTSSSEYLDLLDERRPEALILLAYYAVVLHRRRGSWVIGDAGEYVLGSIASYLGPRWDSWLTWPNNEILPSVRAQ